MSQYVDFLETLAHSVARRGEHVAVEATEGSFTYKELDRLSNQLANRLRTLGVGLPRESVQLATSLRAQPNGATVKISF